MRAKDITRRNNEKLEVALTLDNMKVSMVLPSKFDVSRMYQNIKGVTSKQQT